VKFTALRFYTLGLVTGRFAPSSVRPWTFRPQDVSPPGRNQRFLVTIYILSFIIFKLRLTTFITAMMVMIVLIQLKLKQALGGETSRGRNVHKSYGWLLVKAGVRGCGSDNG